LLLTFFYRQMAELVARGHIYIAQPPLYKIKRGKQEQYVKDDNELNALLLRAALDKAELHVSAEAPAISETALESLAAQYMHVTSMIGRWARRYDENVLEKLLYLPSVAPERFDDRAWLSDWLAGLEQRINRDDTGPTRYAFELAEDPEGKGIQAIRVLRTHHGLTTEKLIQREFFASAEYRMIAQLGEQMVGLLGEGAYVARGERRQTVHEFREAISWLMEEAKRGQTIQRYKGLGEMNPDQLWETTMNPETRRLMQVKIEDAVAADEIFTTLMGDQVEPRRDFIERNALEVANLDI
jgi:DNA gyrase subunit B